MHSETLIVLRSHEGNELVMPAALQAAIVENCRSGDRWLATREADYLTGRGWDFVNGLPITWRNLLIVTRAVSK